MTTYIAYVYKDPDSSFGVSFPDLPGCYGAGETHDEAIASAKISLREYALAKADDGGVMPQPRTHSELHSDVSEAIEMKEAAFVIEVQLVTAGVKRRVNVSLEDSLVRNFDRACELVGVSRSAHLATLMSEWLQTNVGAVIATAAKPKRRSKKQFAMA